MGFPPPGHPIFRPPGGSPPRGGGGGGFPGGAKEATLEGVAADFQVEEDLWPNQPTLKEDIKETN